MTPAERAGLRQAIANDPGNMAWPSKTVSEVLDDLDTAEAELAEYRDAGIGREYAYRYDDGYGIEETSLNAYATVDDAREASRPHHRNATIITRLASDWEPVQPEPIRPSRTERN